MSFNNVLNTFSGKPALQKFVYSATKLEPTQRYGVYWTLTDLATAKEMGLTPVATPQRGRQVRAADCRVACRSGAHHDQAGRRHAAPEPRLQGEPRRLSAVVRRVRARAVRPPGVHRGAERLAAPGHAAAATTTPRTASQALLASWLTYATGAGQSSLPPGFAPLTADLQAQASKAIAAIGKGTTTPVKTPTRRPTKMPCRLRAARSAAGRSRSGSASPGPVASAAMWAPASGLTPRPQARLPPQASATPARAHRRAPAPVRAPHQAAIATVHLPPYLGVKAIDTLAPLLSLVLLILLTAGATIVTAGRPLPDGDEREAPS